MDDFTRKHLEKWCSHQFSPPTDRERIIESMVKVCAEHPDIENGDRGWWRVYEVALESRYYTDHIAYHLHICEDCKNRYHCPIPEYCDTGMMGQCQNCFENLPPDHEVENPPL